MNPGQDDTQRYPAHITFRIDRELPLLGGNDSVSVSIYDQDRLEELLGQIRRAEARLDSAGSIYFDFDYAVGWRDPHPSIVASVVSSDNYEWLVDETDWRNRDVQHQLVDVGKPLHIASGPLGRFSRLGCHFGAKSSFRAFVDKSQMPNFEYHSADIVRRGEIVRGWSRFDPVREVQLLHPNSLGSFAAKHHINPEVSYRDILLWMGERCDDDFGYVWDSLRHSRNEQERPALVTCETARKLSNHCKDFCAEPVFDVDSEIATHSVRAFRLVREMLDSATWQ